MRLATKEVMAGGWLTTVVMVVNQYSVQWWQPLLPQSPAKQRVLNTRHRHTHLSACRGLRNINHSVAHTRNFRITTITNQRTQTNNSYATGQTQLLHGGMYATWCRLIADSRFSLNAPISQANPKRTPTNTRIELTPYALHHYLRQ